MINIEDIRNKLESKMTDKEKYNLLKSTEKELNHPDLNIKKIFAEGQRFNRALFYTVMSVDTLKRLVEKKVKDLEFSTLSAHYLLIRCSLMNHDSEFFSYVAQFMINHKKHYDEPGTALSYAIGYVVGRHVSNGVNVSDLIKIATAPYVSSKEELFNGFKDGYNKNINKSSSLLDSTYYMESFRERYSNWDGRIRNIALNNFALYQKMNDSFTTVMEEKKSHPENEKVIWYFKGLKNNKFMNEVEHVHAQKIVEKKELTYQEELEIRWKKKEEEMLNNIQLSPLYQETVSLSKVVAHAQELLKNEMELLQAKRENLLPNKIKNKIGKIL